MKSSDKNLHLLVDILKPLLGSQLMKQILCVILLLFEVEKKTIIERLGVSYNTVMKYSRLIEADKLHELFEDRRYKPQSELENYREKIIEALDENSARTLREAALIIEQTTGLKRSIPQVREFLKKTTSSC